MQLQIPSFLSGWRLVATLAFTITLMTLGMAVWHQFGVEGVRLGIRATARTSLLLFCLALSAASLYQCWPNGWTRWQRHNRRYLGVSFAVSHAIHAVGIVSFALLDPAQFHQEVTLGSYVVGGIAYTFIIAMAATSFDQTAAWVGPRVWKILHWAGAHYLWLAFVLTTGKRALVNPYYWSAVTLLLAVMAIRLIGWYRARSRPDNLRVRKQVAH
jgi:hypothetical protein